MTVRGRPREDEHALELDAPDYAAQEHPSVAKTLVDLRDGKGEIDDIDHLGNRRVRSSASRWRTSTASASCAWSARPRSGCRRSISTR
jgi:hypothetical protein